MNITAPANINYAATLVRIEAKNFVDLPNCDALKGVFIFGNHVIIGKETQEGELGLYFPVEVALSQEFLGANNLYRKPEHGNADPNAKGYFEEHGRVKAVKFRGHKSEGFYIPLSSLDYILTAEDPIDLAPGLVFDKIGDHDICRKYAPKRREGKSSVQQERAAKLADAIVPGQFRFHYDTENLRRNVHKINPTDYISISDKWHGTSVVIGKILTKRDLRWYERILRKLGVQIMDSQYGLTYSSRKVIKSVNGTEKASNHYYASDIWGVVAQEVEDRIPNGYTLYGEIVGYTRDGAPIQGGYAYGCAEGQHRFLVYRVTSTNVDGKTIELSWPQLTEFCNGYGFEMVPALWDGRAYDLFPELSTKTHWQEEFLPKLESTYVRDAMCPYNDEKVPVEGIVLRVDHLEESEAFKLKNFKFLEWETKALDKGEVDTETAESEEVA